MFEVDDGGGEDDEDFGAYDIDIPTGPPEPARAPISGRGAMGSFDAPAAAPPANRAGYDEEDGEDGAYDVDVGEGIGDTGTPAMRSGGAFVVEALPAPEAYPEEVEEIEEVVAPGDVQAVRSTGSRAEASPVAAAPPSSAPTPAPPAAGSADSSGDGRGGHHSTEFGPAFPIIAGDVAVDDTEQLSLGGEEESVSDYF